MSVEAISWVLNHSKSTRGARLVALSLANYAHKDGTNSFPAVETIATDARLSERAVQYALRRLERMGEIQRSPEQVQKTVTWDILIGVQELHPKRSSRVQVTTERGARHAPEPRTNQENVRAKALTPAAENPEPPKLRKADPLWDALLEELGPVETKSERGKRNKALVELREIAATPEEVRRRCNVYRATWPKVSLTATALVAHWSELNGAGHLTKEQRRELDNQRLQERMATYDPARGIGV